MNMKLPKVLAGALLVLALCLFLVTPAFAQPAPPLLFTGDVTIGGVDALIGTTISAEIEDVEVASTTTSVLGHYAIQVEGSVGDMVVFKVNGVVGGQREYVDPWETPSVTLDLAIEGEAPVTYYTLTVDVSPSGGGSVSLSPSQPVGGYEAGTTVTLTASAASGYEFDSWSGDLTGSTNPDTIVMDEAKSVTANFTEEAAPAPTPGVGGTAYLPDKLAILTPWIVGLGAAILIGGITWLALRRRRSLG